jgi:hypothetical protein
MVAGMIMEKSINHLEVWQKELAVHVDIGRILWHFECENVNYSYRCSLLLNEATSDYCVREFHLHKAYHSFRLSFLLDRLL